MFSNSLRIALILLLAGAAAALAQVSVIPILIEPISTPIVGALLLEDNASILLLEDNASSLCLEGGC
jgi:hypothetical protein